MSLAEYDFQVLYMDSANCWHDEDRYARRGAAESAAERISSRPHVKKVRVVKRDVIYESINYGECEE